ncbi:MAG: hypothetical protein J6R17_01980 [Bacteroidales bacterium]|nr:hypothetical protein [Bacteroidales bacterium]
MKNHYRLLSLLACVIFCGLTSNLFSQDVIFLSNGNEIEAKIIKIGDSEIEYKKWSNQEGPTFTEKASNIFMIKYQNGEKEIFENKQNDVNKQSVVITKPNEDMYIEIVGGKYYYYQGKQITTKEQLLDIYKKNNCNNAYEVYENAIQQYKTGTTFYCIGLPLTAVGIPLFISGLLESNDILKAIGSPMAICGPIFFIGGLASVINSNNEARRSIDIYNNQIAKKNNDVSLNLGISSTGGIGLSLRF